MNSQYFQMHPVQGWVRNYVKSFKILSSHLCSYLRLWGHLWIYCRSHRCSVRCSISKLMEQWKLLMGVLRRCWPRSWLAFLKTDLYLPVVLFAYWEVPKRSTGFVIYELLLGNNCLASAWILLIADYESGSDDFTEEVPSLVTLQKDMWKDVTINKALPVSYQSKIVEILKSYEDIFTEVSGKTSEAVHKIVLTNKTPIKVRQYNLRLDSVLSFPLVVIMKKDKSLQLCADYRKLNARTVMEAGGTLNPEDIYMRLHGALFLLQR